MIPIVLLGNPGTKRTVYFQKAAAQMGIPCILWKWGEPPPAFPAGSCVKIDPPVWDSCDLGKMEDFIRRYRDDLRKLSRLAKERGFHFLNRPEAIGALLDKRQCKRILLQAGLPATEPLTPSREGLAENFADAEQLMERMAARRMFQVFLKPVCGSGAAGTAAFRFQPKSGKMALYACAIWEESSGQLLNTRRLRRFSERGQIFPLLNRILKLDCIVERWHAKAQCRGCSYDLRAVVQEGRLDYLLARLSKGPITNLHLNNRPLPAEALDLPSGTMEAVSDLCRRAVRAFPGLASAGVDILLERGNLKPRIIEMNGQGDLIYQDIFHENAVYRRQVRLMANG